MMNMFSYSGYMVIDLLPGKTVDNVGSYAGLLASSFMAGRTLTAYAWGKSADVYGRTFVLEWTLILAGIFSLLFGTSKSLTEALIWRFLAGMSNGTLSATKTMATELSFGDEVVERRIMGMVVGMRSWGLLICPAIGGALAEPLSQYPQLQPPAWIRYVLTKSPFLLPNLVAFVLCILTAMMVSCYMPETLPPQKRRSRRRIPEDVCIAFRSTLTRLTKTLCGWRGTADEHLGLLLPIRKDTFAHVKPEPSIMSRPATRRHLMIHWLFSFCTSLVDEAFPLFCMSAAGGLGMGEASIGEILSLAGLVFASLQYVTYIVTVNRCGVYNSLVIGCVLGFQPLLLIPLSLRMNNPIVMSIFLALTIGVCKVFQSVFFTCISLGVNKTVPASQRATMNGIQLMGGSVARSCGPIVAGNLTSFAFSRFASTGSMLVFSTIALIAWIVTSRIWVLRQYAVAEASSSGLQH